MSQQTVKAETRSVTDKVESFISYGSPTCDVCREIDRESRPDRAEYWPDEAVHYINHNKSSAYEWWGTTLCDHHDHPINQPEEATHRVVNEPRFVGDQQERMNSAYKHNVVECEEL